MVWKHEFSDCFHCIEFPPFSTMFGNAVGKWKMENTRPVKQPEVIVLKSQCALTWVLLPFINDLLCRFTFCNTFSQNSTTFCHCLEFISFIKNTLSFSFTRRKLHGLHAFSCLFWFLFTFSWDLNSFL